MSRRGPMREGAGVAGGVAAAILFGFLLLPGVLALLLYLFITITGMVEGTDLRASTLDLPVLFAGIAVIVAALVVGLLAGAGLVGRSLTPRKRRSS